MKALRDRARVEVGGGGGGGGSLVTVTSAWHETLSCK